jgi:hypothetical protein
MVFFAFFILLASHCNSIAGPYRKPTSFSHNVLSLISIQWTQIWNILLIDAEDMELIANTQSTFEGLL